MNEFSIIDRYFNWHQSSVVVGIGDDCAVIDNDSDKQTVTSVDTLIGGVHFTSDTSPADIAYKSLAVNLSDIAAMGATPSHFTLAITLPQFDESWVSEFSQGLKEAARKYSVSLVGGDTTRGPLSITINVFGVINKGDSILRSGAIKGDLIFVSKTLGDAAYAWSQIQSNEKPSISLTESLNRPEPRIALGQRLVGIANSCIDISDGLEQDLSHILQSSKVGAIIDINKLPLSEPVREYISNTRDWCVALAGGDDYELCFSVNKANKDKIRSIERELNIPLTEIGRVTTGGGLIVNGFSGECKSYSHF